MAHPEYWQAMDAYADGMLDASEVERLEEHLRGCQECQRRLRAVQRETEILRTVLAPARPPPDLVPAVMARIGAAQPRRGLLIRPGLYAGIASSLATAVILVLLSLGTQASFLLMMVVALGTAIVWGALKGLVFAGSLRFLPRGLLARAALFAFGVWAVTNALLALFGGYGTGSPFSASFLLVGSAVHAAVYGLLISWLFAYFTGALKASDSARVMLASVLLIGVHTPTWTGEGMSVPHHHGVPAHAVTKTRWGAPVAPAPGTATPTPTATATPTKGHGTPGHATVTLTPTTTATATASPTVSQTSSATATAAASATAASPTATPTKTRTSRSQKPGGVNPSVQHQVRSILPSVVAPQGASGFTGRVRDALVLLNFL